ncbi:Bax inhibitor-1/YccA family protein [Maricaulis sp.]|uniref:Bax inhibitor-1/YccA family protein n=1 Tax=Maricaulis sp. TaxID=1486257 RepID=UPI003A8E9F3D
MNDFSRTHAGAPSMDMSVDAGLRSYMLGIYNLMTIGLLVTAGAAILAAQLFFVGIGTESFGVTPLGNTIFNTPLKWVVMLAPLGMVMLISFRLNKLSSGMARTLFYVFAGVMGISLSSIIAVYTAGSIANTFFVTAAAFGALSLYGYTTKRNLTGMGSFLMMGLFGLILASIVNIFLASSAMEFAISAIGVLIFAGLTAYDTQRLKISYYEYGGTPELAAKMKVHGALSLYLDFINMFLFLLRFMGNRN